VQNSQPTIASPSCDISVTLGTMHCNALQQIYDVVAELLRCSPTHRHPLQLLSVQHYPFILKVCYCSLMLWLLVFHRCLFNAQSAGVLTTVSTLLRVSPLQQSCDQLPGVSLLSICVAQ